MTSISIYPSMAQSIPVSQSKICNKCKESKSLKEFYKKKDSADGLTSQCKSCAKERSDEYYQNNKGKRQEYQKTNKERPKEYKQHKQQYLREYYQANKAEYGARNAKRRGIKLNATPFWSELELIQQLYDECITLSKSTGIQYHVDHIIPLQSKIVCGLHCIANLQIITATENLSKSNLYWPDMP